MYEEKQTNREGLVFPLETDRFLGVKAFNAKRNIGAPVTIHWTAILGQQQRLLLIRKSTRIGP